MWENLEFPDPIRNKIFLVQLKIISSESKQQVKSSTILIEKKESESQTEPTVEVSASKDNMYNGNDKFKHIDCRYFYKGKGCRRGQKCWYSHNERTTEERVCFYWLEGRCRYTETFCRSGRHQREANYIV